MYGCKQGRRLISDLRKNTRYLSKNSGIHPFILIAIPDSDTDQDKILKTEVNVDKQ